MRPITTAIELPNRAMDVYEAADVCGCNVDTMRREIRRGRLRATKVGSRWRVTPDAVSDYLDRETAATMADRVAWDAHVRAVIDTLPPLTQTQRDKLVTLLRVSGA